MQLLIIVKHRLQFCTRLQLHHQAGGGRQLRQLQQGDGQVERDDRGTAGKNMFKSYKNIFNLHKNIYRSKRLTWWLPTSPSRTSASREWTSRCPSWTWAWRSSTRSRPRRILICSPSYLRCLLTSGSTSSRLIWPCPSCSSQSLGKSAHQQQHFECFSCQHS